MCEGKKMMPVNYISDCHCWTRSRSNCWACSNAVTPKKSQTYLIWWQGTIELASNKKCCRARFDVFVVMAMFAFWIINDGGRCRKGMRVLSFRCRFFRHFDTKLFEELRQKNILRSFLAALALFFVNATRMTRLF